MMWHIQKCVDYDEMGNMLEDIEVTNHDRYYRCYSRDDAEWLLKVLESTGEDINYDDLKSEHDEHR